MYSPKDMLAEKSLTVDQIVQKSSFRAAYKKKRPNDDLSTKSVSENVGDRSILSTAMADEPDPLLE